MTSYDVTLTRWETATVRVEAEDSENAKEVARSVAEAAWEPETGALDVDGVRQVTEHDYEPGEMQCP